MDTGGGRARDEGGYPPNFFGHAGMLPCDTRRLNSFMCNAQVEQGAIIELERLVPRSSAADSPTHVDATDMRADGK